MTNEDIRDETGCVSDPRPLVGFLYDLMRDKLPVGDVQQLVSASDMIGPSNICKFTNGHLARCAQMFADALTASPLRTAAAAAFGRAPAGNSETQMILLATARKYTPSGDIYTEQELRDRADGDRFIFDELTNQLFYRMVTLTRTEQEP